VFKKALARRLEDPIVATARLSGLSLVCYKIKLRSLGYRLIYTVEENELIVLVLTVNRRDTVYKKLSAQVDNVKNKQ
ncbi:type II toxin-antitoxin system RelE/ParE family toxin, partial [Acinetobacter baumannii]